MRNNVSTPKVIGGAASVQSVRDEPGDVAGASIGGGATSTRSIGTSSLKVFSPRGARRMMITVFSFTCSILCGPVAIGANLCRLPVSALDLTTRRKTYFASYIFFFRLRRLSSKFLLYRSCALRPSLLPLTPVISPPILRAGLLSRLRLLSLPIFNSQWIGRDQVTWSDPRG